MDRLLGVLPPEFLQDLIARTDITEVVGRHVALKKAGINHKGLCPFHGEKSPSFIVSPSRQTYHCFGCGAHGDAIRFLTEHTGLGFMDAVRELAQQAGLTVPDDRSSDEDRARAAASKAKSATLTEVLAKAGEHFRGALKTSPRAIDYLKRRGLTGAVAAQYGLGYAPDGWRTLASVFAHYDDPLLVESGLVVLHEATATDGTAASDEKRYDRFRDRVMFPIRSVRGEVIGFGGRVLDQGEPKYLNSPETPVFHKGQELYGLFEARQALRKSGYALVVEGYMDVVALAQAGFGHAVATLGTACTAEHVAKLFRFTEAVVFSFDGDAAGRRAAARALEAALPHASDTRSIRFLFLPTEHDPDSFVREQGAAAFEQAIAQAVPLSAQMLAQAAEGCDMATPEGRARMLAQARPLLQALPDGLLQVQLLQMLAQQVGMSVDALQGHWQHQGKPAAPTPASRSAGNGPGANSDGRPPPGGQNRWRKSARATPQAATRLDRAAWLLTRHAEQWLGLSDALHGWLCAQPAPHGSFFATLERLLHDHGPVTLQAILADMADPDHGPHGSADEPTLSLLRRIAEFDALNRDPPSSDLDAVLRQLELAEMSDELKAITESGPLDSTDLERVRTLYARQKALAQRPGE